MAHPIPGKIVTTPFGKHGGWECNKHADGLGHHTGDDYSTFGQIGFNVHATASGEVVIVSQGSGGWGSAYGKHVVIESGDVRHGYCHLDRIFVSVGQRVSTGQLIGKSGNTGRVEGSIGPHFGAHLHYEERTGDFLYCNVARKPQLSRGPGPGATIAVGTVLVSKLHVGVEDSDSVRRLQDVLNGLAVTGELIRVSGNYRSRTREEVRAWQIQVVGEQPDSPFAQGNLGPRQARRIFARTGNAVFDDTDDNPET